MTLRKAAIAAGAVTLLSLGGCITLFPKADPVQLYRFGQPVASKVSATAGARTYNLSRSTTVFNRAALSDRILTVSGSETAYIAGARWVSPAILLFDEAMTQAFDEAPGCTRLLTRGDPSVPDGLLRVEVRNFEARYLDGPEAAPTAYVEARVSLISGRDRTVLAERTVHAEQRAAENRVSAIVTAMDAATAQVLKEVTGAANAEAARQGCGVGPSPAAATSRTTTTTTVTPR